MNAILEYCARQRVLVILVALVLAGAGYWSVKHTALDAVPDVSDTQVIIYSKWDGQSPRVIEDQITYPLLTTMLHVPGAADVRGYSAFGYSLIYVLFEEGTDIYWARSRVLEYLDQVRGKLPAAADVSLGPDATGVGWVYQYALRSARHDLAELRSLQDWYLRYALEAVPGVSEVASVGGYVRQYQVEVDPARLRAYRIPFDDVVAAVERSNRDEGGRLIEHSGAEYLIRGLGYVTSVADLEQVPVKMGEQGVPVTIGQLGRVHFGTDVRRGIAELNGEGQVAGGIVVMQHGANASRVIRDVKAALGEAKKGLPAGVGVVPVYDRAPLIDASVATLVHALWYESLVVAAIVLLFLWHLRSTLVIILTLPVAILIAFIFTRWMGITMNIMSLGGIAIAIGAMVDAAIVMVENAHKHVERLGRDPDPAEHAAAVMAGMKEVATPIFVSLVVLTLSFLPLLMLTGEEGRLFTPLVWTKTFAMGAAALLSITLIPALMMYFVRGRIFNEQSNPVSTALIGLYRPILEVTLRLRLATVGLFVALGLVTVPVFNGLGKEFMPPLYEGSLMYMPTTLPGVSVSEIGRVMQNQDRELKRIPEVETVFGKAGRADSATDPAPLSMIETVITLKPRDQWRPGLTANELVREMDAAVSIPGLVSGWTMPIRGRIDMLTTGIRTPLGIKVYGSDLEVLDRVAGQMEGVLANLPGSENVYADRTTRGYYVDVTVDRRQAARYGLNVADVQEVLRTAVGGANLGWTVEGRERYPINVRYQADHRDDIDALRREVMVPFGDGDYIPLGVVTDIRVTQAATEVKSENGLLVNYVYIDLAGRDAGSYVAAAEAAISDGVALPEGVYYEWSGSYRNLERAWDTFAYVIPLTLLVILVLYYLVFQSLTKALLVMVAIPFSLIGAVWLLALLDYHLSVAVVVGLLALLGVAAETAVVMIIYLETAVKRRRQEGTLRTRQDLFDAIHEGAVLRLRPKIMTVATIGLSLMPLMLSDGVGADVMRRIAAPMVGGVASSLVLVLLIIPAVYSWIEQRRLGAAPVQPGATHEDP
ncbi:MAG: CusA/CzcA family heavy metal efflux RND transporter [Gammaproteobacteria bacterium]|nr:CusA/CzcA family heavy metal efflux RND transporter [Gammaproteobacteria bacterium]